jgi:membrane fusion protein (multidrug efflux system)
MFARARTEFSACAKNAVVVPEEALVPLGNKQLLIKVVDGAAGQEGRRSAWRPRSACVVPGKAEVRGRR